MLDTGRGMTAFDKRVTQYCRSADAVGTGERLLHFSVNSVTSDFRDTHMAWIS